MKLKTAHWAALMDDAGHVSALCFAKPRAIDLSRATWTICPEYVTCARCRKLMPLDSETRGEG